MHPWRHTADTMCEGASWEADRLQYKGVTEGKGQPQHCVLEATQQIQCVGLHGARLTDFSTKAPQRAKGSPSSSFLKLHSRHSVWGCMVGG